MCLAADGAAQSPQQTPVPPRKQDDRTIRVDVDLVLVPVTVTDPYGRLVTGLDLGAFRLFEDGVEQELTHIFMEDSPISVGMVLDISGSMKSQANEARQMAIQFFKNANRGDEFMLVEFRDRAGLVSGFTTNADDLFNDVFYTESKGQTALFDALFLGLSQMRRASNPRRALIVISDGDENHSRYNEKDVHDLARESNAQVYAVGGFSDIGAGILHKLTQLTGGRMFPGYYMEDTISRIWGELREQYVLGYRSSNRKSDGRWRKIKVRLRMTGRNMPVLQVYAKPGYLAPPL